MGQAPPDRTDESVKRRLLRRTPGLSRLAESIDALKAENSHLAQWSTNLEAETARLRDENLRLHGLIGSHAAENERLVALLANLSQPWLLGDETADAQTERANDGWPLPPPLLRYWVAGTDDPEWFLEGGRLGARTVTEVLARNGIAFGSLARVLDFGCGCGRVLRVLSQYDQVELHGSDCNATAVAWCETQLTFGRFGTNRLTPPTRYEAQTFDLVYAFSVFSHFPEPLQRAWMAELHRILKPGGLLLISVHGDYYLDKLDEPERAAYHRGDLAVLGTEKAGGNDCAAFHPEAYVRNVMANGFDVVDVVPEGALGNPRQDVYLLRRR